jgi:hypothetical protein
VWDSSAAGQAIFLGKVTSEMAAMLKLLISIGIRKVNETARWFQPVTWPALASDNQKCRFFSTATFRCVQVQNRQNVFERMKFEIKKIKDF